MHRAASRSAPAGRSGRRHRGIGVRRFAAATTGHRSAADDPIGHRARRAAQPPGGHPDSTGLAALVLLFRDAGFRVIDESRHNATLVPPARPASGLTVQAGDLLHLHELIDAGEAVSLADILASLQALLGIAHPVPFAVTLAELRADVRAAMRTATGRVWAETLIHGDPDGAAFATSNPVSDIELGPVQTVLVLDHLLADAAHTALHTGDTLPDGPVEPAPAIGGMPAGLVAGACDLTGALDESARGAINGSAAESAGQAIDGILRASTHRASSALDALDTLWPMVQIFLSTEFFRGTTSQRWAPLVRTKSHEPRASIVTAHLAVATPDRSYLSACLRSLLAGFSSRPDTGDLAGLGVRWATVSAGVIDFAGFCVCATAVDVATEGTDANGDTTEPITGRHVVRLTVDRKTVGDAAIRAFRTLADAARTATHARTPIVVRATEAGRAFTDYGFLGFRLYHRVTPWDAMPTRVDIHDAAAGIDAEVVLQRRDDCSETSCTFVTSSATARLSGGVACSESAIRGMTIAPPWNSYRGGATITIGASAGTLTLGWSGRPATRRCGGLAASALNIGDRTTHAFVAGTTATSFTENTHTETVVVTFTY
jgi:hypothetical protein